MNILSFSLLTSGEARVEKRGFSTRSARRGYQMTRMSAGAPGRSSST